MILLLRPSSQVSLLYVALGTHLPQCATLHTSKLCSWDNGLDYRQVFGGSRTFGGRVLAAWRCWQLGTPFGQLKTIIETAWHVRLCQR